MGCEQYQWEIFTDFLVSDKKGNVMHCSAKNNIAYCFDDKLKEGFVYSMKGYIVQPNKHEYRIMKDDTYILELQGSTSVSKITTDVAGFIRYPFQLIDFEKMEPTEKKYFIGKLSSLLFSINIMIPT